MSKKILKLLFDEGEKICAGSLYKNEIKQFDQFDNCEFFTANSLGNVDHAYRKSEKYEYLKPRRADINVCCFRNFMFEMDNEDLENQMKILKGCGIPWTTIVYSGSKSYHAILSLEEPLSGCHTKEGVNNYKHIWKRLAMYIEQYANSLGFSNVIDPSCKNPSRFTRFPSFIRKTGNEQKVMHTGTRISAVCFNKLLRLCPRVFVSVVKPMDKLEVKNVQDFFENGPQALVDEVKYPMNIAPSGQYPKILRLSLWARDLGIDKELWINILNYRFFPALLKVGYPEHKLETAIDHAYRR